MYFFITILLLSILLVLFCFIEIHIKDFEYSSSKLINNYKVCIILKIKIFNKLTIYTTKIDNNKLKEEKMKEKLSSIEKSAIENRNKLNTESLKILKNLKIELKELNFKVKIGTTDAAQNALIVSIISIIISMILGFIKKQEKNVQWKISPIYQNKNVLKIYVNSIFYMNLLHIIYTAYLLIKKGEENVKSSYRKSYVNSNE